MAQPVAKQGDKVHATDTHNVIPQPGANPVPTPMPFVGMLDDSLSPTVLAQGKAVAVQGSVAHQSPGHLVAPPATFQNPPKNRGIVVAGAPTVLANGVPVARNTDKAATCNDPGDLPIGTIVATGTVLVG